jgi:GNAT superfamily N-acetyltransferase
VELTTTVLADDPALAEPMWAMESTWPEFMRHDPIGGMYYGNCTTLFAEYVVIGRDETGEVVAMAHSVPFVLDDEDLPPNGWDFAIRSGLLAAVRGETPNAVSAIEIAVRRDLQGTGLSGRMLAAMRDNAARHGFAELVAPVRPNGKADPHEPMAAYAVRTRDDGLPADPWLRVHVRAGGVIDSVAPRSMVIPGTVAEWREWTGLPFDASGPVEVPKALAPVWCDLEHGTATYVEPNVWVRHRTGA